MRLHLLAPLLLALLPWHCLPAAAQTLNYPVAYAFSPALQGLQQGASQCALPPQTCQTGCVGITIKLDCAGISQLSTGDGPPPDTNAAVGDTQVVEFVNNSYQVFDKTTGAQLTQPIDDKDLFQSLPDDSACKVQDGGDIIVDWDKANHVWLLAYNIGSPIGPGNTYPLCVAVSTSADATSSYNVYQYSLGAYFADYPKWGLWPTGYFQTNDNTTYGPLVCAYNGAKMRAGDPTAEQICRRFGILDFHLLPADADSAPPTGQDEFFIGSMGFSTRPPALVPVTTHSTYIQCTPCFRILFRRPLRESIWLTQSACRVTYHILLITSPRRGPTISWPPWATHPCTVSPTGMTERCTMAECSIGT